MSATASTAYPWRCQACTAPASHVHLLPFDHLARPPERAVLVCPDCDPGGYWLDIGDWLWGEPDAEDVAERPLLREEVKSKVHGAAAVALVDELLDHPDGLPTIELPERTTTQVLLDAALGPDDGSFASAFVEESLTSQHAGADHPSDQGAGPPLDELADGAWSIRLALLDDTEDTLSGSHTPREPVPGTGGLLWRGIAHTFFGERGEGKSVVAVVITVAAAVEGERALYFDRENGPALLRSLVEGVLEAHPDWPDVFADRAWEGRHYPAFNRDWKPDDLAEAVAGLGYTGVVYDSVRETMSELGGNPNAEEDYSTLMRVLVTPLLRRGLWVALLDNVGHVEKGRPKGSGSKLDAVPIAYQVRTSEPFDVVTEGAVEIRCTRSRYGDTGREWSLRVGGGRFDVPTSRNESPDQRAAREIEERYKWFARDIVAELAKDAPLGRDELLKRVKGARVATLREWLARLVEDPTSAVIHDPKGGYSLAPERGGPEGWSRPPVGDSRTTPPRTTPDEGLVDAVTSAFDATEIDAHGNPIGGTR